jgi:hypothetical protein
MRDVFGIFFVAFITGTPLLACHFALLSQKLNEPIGQVSQSK